MTTGAMPLKHTTHIFFISSRNQIYHSTNYTTSGLVVVCGEQIWEQGLVKALRVISEQTRPEGYLGNDGPLKAVDRLMDFSRAKRPTCPLRLRRHHLLSLPERNGQSPVTHTDDLPLGAWQLCRPGHTTRQSTDILDIYI